MPAPAPSALLGPSELVALHAERSPFAEAVSYDGNRMAYAEFDLLANGIACALVDAGLASSDVVGVYLDHTPAWFATYIGVLRAGCAYLPLDPAYPSSRLRFMVRDAEAKLIVTARWLTSPSLDLPTLELEDPWAPLPPASTAPSRRTLEEDDLAAVLYTSGTTGRPKGVRRPRRALAMSAYGLARGLSLSPVDRFLQIAPSTHGACVAELNMAVVCGGTLCLGRPEELVPGSAMADFIEASRITVAQMTPSVMSLLPDRPYSSLRALSVGGEPVLPEHIIRWAPRFDVYGNYGSTEATTTAGRLLTVDCLEDGAVPIGPPLPHVSLSILDANRLPVSVGAEGEVFVSGPGIALGYVGDQVQDRFITLAGNPERTWYRTGDRGRMTVEGDLILLGRWDDQIKVGGVRVELSEVQAVALSHTGVSRVLVKGHRGEDGVTRLALYYVPAIQGDVSEAEIRAYLRERLPEAFLPTFVVPMKSFPLNRIGKLDREALPDPAVAQGREVQSNLTEVERVVLASWESALGYPPGVEQAFMDAGGTSLSALRVLASLEEATGVRLSMGDLVTAMNVVDLAGRIVGPGMGGALSRPKGASSLVPLQPQGDLAPLFFIPGINGTVPGIRGLARRIGRGLGDTPDLPVYGLQPGGVVDPDYLLDDVGAIADSFADTIEARQPSGPIRILGFSAGGGFALEVARRLLESGRQIGFVGSLDGRNPRAVPRRTEVGGIGRMLRNLPRGLAALRQFERRRIDAGVRRLQQRVWRALERGEEPAFLDTVEAEDLFTDTGWPDEIRRLAATHQIALFKHRFDKYPGRFYVFPAAVQPFLDPIPRDLGWTDLCGHVAVTPVPGYHVGLVRRPYVGRVARIVRKTLDETTLD